MDRLQTKCLVASAGFHGVLAAVLLGSSIIHLPPRPNSASAETEASIIELVSVPSDQAAVTPSPTLAKPAQRSDGSRLTAVGPQVSTVPHQSAIPKSSTSDSAVVGRHDLSHSAKPVAPNNSRMVEFSRMLEDMAKRLPAGKAIELEIGSAETGKDDAYARIVKFFYSQSWEPAAAENSDPKIGTKAKVTIVSDGKVASAHIVQSSGDARLDESVRQALDRVQFIEPFEPAAKESERSYTINFRLGGGVSGAE